MKLFKRFERVGNGHQTPPILSPQRLPGGNTTGCLGPSEVSIVIRAGLCHPKTARIACDDDTPLCEGSCGIDGEGSPQVAVSRTEASPGVYPGMLRLSG